MSFRCCWAFARLFEDRIWSAIYCKQVRFTRRKPQSRVQVFLNFFHFINKDKHLFKHLFKRPFPPSFCRYYHRSKVISNQSVRNIFLCISIVSLHIKLTLNDWLTYLFVFLGILLWTWLLCMPASARWARPSLLCARPSCWLKLPKITFASSTFSPGFTGNPGLT